MSEKNNCLNCHFFVKYTNHGTPLQKTEILKKSARQKIEEDNKYPPLKDHPLSLESNHYGCHRGVWSGTVTEFTTKSNEEKLHNITVNREWSCFFHEHNLNGMSLEAAEELEKRNTQSRVTSEDRRYSNWALYIATAMLVITFVYYAWDMFH